MTVRLLILMLGLGLGIQAHADSRGGVYVYQPNGGSYRIESRPSYRYDPRSPYSNHRQYPQNLPPRYQGQLPPQYYDRHRGVDRNRWNQDRRNETHRLQRRDDRGRPDLDRPQRWQPDDPRRFSRPPLIRDRHDYRVQRDRNFGNRGYSR